MVIIGGGDTDWEEHKGGFWDAGDSIHLDLGSGYSVYTYIKIY